MKRLIFVKLLIIEDSTVSRKSVKEGLRNYNFEFLEAETGAAGLKLALQHKPDIILLDLNLPDTNGFEVMQKIRLSQYGATVPIIIATVSNKTNDVEKSMTGGAQYYMVKPINIGKLLNKIVELLNITEEEISSDSFKKVEIVNENMGDIDINKTVSFQKTEVKNLKPKMIIGISVSNTDGKILYKAGTELDEEKISKLTKNDVEYIYIKPS